MLRQLLPWVALGVLSISARAQDPAKEKPVDPKELAKASDEHVSGKEFHGMSEMDVFRRLGPPTKWTPEVWEYSGGLRELTSFVIVRVVVFKDGKVVSAEQRPRNLGCVYWGPRKR